MNRQEQIDHWKTKHLQPVKNLNIETMVESFVIATMLDDGSSAKLGGNDGILTFKTIDDANAYIKHLRGED